MDRTTEEDAVTGGAQLVQQALAAAREGDERALSRLLADDFVWSVPGRGRIAGEVRGTQGVLDRIRTIVGAGVRPQVLDVLEGDGHVAVLQRNTADGGGRSLDVRVLNLYAVRDGVLARQETFFGDQDAADRFWAAP